MLGGDYWGGTFQLSLPTDIMSQHKLISSFIEDKRQLEEELNEISTQPENILKSLRRQIFVQSNRSVLFGNIRSGFACPAANPRRSYSPFMSTKMIQLFLLCDDDLLENYQFFIEVLKKLETAGDYFFPICSFLNSVDNRWDAPQGWGVSPKLQMPAYSPTKKNEWNENLKLFKNLLENQCDGFLPEEIEKILNHSELEGLFTGLVYSFLYSFHARFLEVYKNRIEIESK